MLRREYVRLGQLTTGRTPFVAPVWDDSGLIGAAAGVVDPEYRDPPVHGSLPELTGAGAGAGALCGAR